MDKYIMGMKYLELGELDKAIERSYIKGELSENAKIIIGKIHHNVLESFPLEFSKTIPKVVKQTVLNNMIDNWKGHHMAKKSITAYFPPLLVLFSDQRLHEPGIRVKT